MASMTPGETVTFLDEPPIAHRVTLRADGTPHSELVWYEYPDGIFVMVASSQARKVKNLRTDPWATISVASEDEPYRYVIAEGPIATRYRGPERGREFVADLMRAHPMAVLTLKPSRLTTYKGDS